MKKNQTIHDVSEVDLNLVERVAENYKPAPFTPNQRARFDTNLRERIENRRRSPLLIPSLAAAVVAVFALGWIVTSDFAPTPETGIEIAVSDTSWETEVLIVDVDSGLIDEEYLPGEYEVIAYAFLDGV